MSTNPQKSKVFLFILKSDVTDETIKNEIVGIRVAGGIVAVINANDLVDKTNFITLVSKEELIFETSSFDELPAYRYIERKLCKSKYLGVFKRESFVKVSIWVFLCSPKGAYSRRFVPPSV